MHAHLGGFFLAFRNPGHDKNMTLFVIFFLAYPHLTNFNLLGLAIVDGNVVSLVMNPARISHAPRSSY